MAIRSLLEIRAELARLSELTLAAQSALVGRYSQVALASDRAAAVTGLLSSIGLPSSDLATAHGAFLRMIASGDGQHDARWRQLIHLVGPKSSLGVGLAVHEQGEGGADLGRRLVVLPEGMVDATVPFASRRLTDPSMPPAYDLAGIEAQRVRPGPMGGVKDRPYAIRQVAQVIARHAPPGSVFRKMLLRELRSLLMGQDLSPETPMSLERLKQALVGLQIFTEALAGDMRRVHSERYTYGVHYRRIVDLLLDIDAGGLRLFSKRARRSYEMLQLVFEMIPRPQRFARPDPASLRNEITAFLEGPSTDAGYRERIGALKKGLLEGVFRVDDPGHLSQMRIAVAAFGMNVDTLAFFVDLGFRVAGIEKWSAGGEQAASGRPLVDPEDPFLDSVGLPELAQLTTDWDRLSPDEVREALGHPRNLEFFDADSPDLPVGQFDLVVVPAIIDEAHETAARLVRIGGHLWADHYVHPDYRTTREGVVFARHSLAEYGIPFATLFDEPFRKEERHLPTDFQGDHQVYVLRRLDPVEHLAWQTALLLDRPEEFSGLGSVDAMDEALSELVPWIRGAFVSGGDAFMGFLRRKLEGLSPPEDAGAAERRDAFYRKFVRTIARLDELTEGADHANTFFLPWYFDLSDLFPFRGIDDEIARIVDVERRYDWLAQNSIEPWGSDITFLSGPGRNDFFYDVLIEGLFPLLGLGDRPFTIHQAADASGVESALLLRKLGSYPQARVVSSNDVRDLYYFSQGDRKAIIGSGGQLITFLAGERAFARRSTPERRAIAEIEDVVRRFELSRLGDREEWGDIRMRRVRLIHPAFHRALQVDPDRVFSVEADLRDEASLRRAVPNGAADVVTIFNTIARESVPRDAVPQLLANAGRTVSEGGIVMVGVSGGIPKRLTLYRREGGRLAPMRLPGLNWGPGTVTDSHTSFDEGIDL